MLEALSEFHFLRPWWLAGVAAIPFVVLLLRRAVGGINRWREAIAPELLAVLMEQTPQVTKHPLTWFVSIAMVLSIVALAGPTWERRPDDVERQNDGLVIVLDLSLSMYVEDVQPSRIERAKHKITDILARRKEGYTGLVGYAGDSHTVTPLTDDIRTVTNLLSALAPGMMPVHGSKPSGALAAARDLLINAGMVQGRILLITDGVDRVSEVTEHAHPDYPISILGIGTSRGALFPRSIANDIERALGTDVTSVRPKLDEERLRSLASICRGRYHSVTVSDDDIDHLLATPLVDLGQTLNVDREFDSWHDVGYWLVIPLMCLVIFAFRRGALAVLVIAVGFPADANIWDDLWSRRDQQAFSALLDGQPERASALFQDDQWRGVAKYRSDDFQGAAMEFSYDASTDGVFNLGNALAKSGSYPEAIAAYDAVLKREPEHEDAAFNKALIEELLQREQDSEGNPNQEQDDNQSPSGEQQQSDPQAGADQQQQSEESPGEESEQEPTRDEQFDEQQDKSRDEDERAQELAEAEARERADANEQWLRKIPDDPAGLMRNKFKHETNMRLRSGELRRPRSEQVW